MKRRVLKGGFGTTRSALSPTLFQRIREANPKPMSPPPSVDGSTLLLSLARAEPAMALQRGTREGIVTVACPIGMNSPIGARTMARVPVATGRAYDEVTRGLALLLVFAVGSGILLITATIAGPLTSAALKVHCAPPEAVACP